MVDMHCDESDDPLSRHVETLAAETQRLGLQERVDRIASDLDALDGQLLRRQADPADGRGRLNAVANPLINITLQGRHDSYPKRRGHDAGRGNAGGRRQCRFGHDCVMDPWYSLGRGDMLEVAHMGLHGAPMTGREAIRGVRRGDEFGRAHARAAGLGARGRKRADMVLLQAADPIEALRLRATRLFVIRRGEIVARTPARETELSLAGRPSRLDPASYAPVAARLTRSGAAPEFSISGSGGASLPAGGARTAGICWIPDLRRYVGTHYLRTKDACIRSPADGRTGRTPDLPASPGNARYPPLCCRSGPHASLVPGRAVTSSTIPACSNPAGPARSEMIPASATTPPDRSSPGTCQKAFPQ